MAMQVNPSANFSPASGSTVDPAEIAKFSKLSQEWWDPNGKMAPLHKINPLRLRSSAMPPAASSSAASAA